MSDQHVRIAQLAVAKGTGRLIAVGLGSCVAVILYDRARRVGGLAHVLLPAGAARDESSPARVAPLAVPALIARMQGLGARAPFEARLVGGAALFGTMLVGADGSMGDRNVAAVRAALSVAGVSVQASDVGGSSGRSVTLDVASGSVMVRGVRGGERVL
ncbi:MAG: hypothetical protein KF709_13535 [Gemmatimonadaceae bacterium]|nr:hypothetical protein [Gemmatimonadaceae bacterium]